MKNTLPFLLFLSSFFGSEAQKFSPNGFEEYYPHHYNMLSVVGVSPEEFSKSFVMALRADDTSLAPAFFTELYFEETVYLDEEFIRNCTILDSISEEIKRYLILPEQADEQSCPLPWENSYMEIFSPVVFPVALFISETTCSGFFLFTEFLEEGSFISTGIFLGVVALK